MANIGPTQLIIILLIVVLLFGAKKIPEIAKGLGKGIKDFKGALKEDETDDKGNATASPDAAKTAEKPPVKPSVDSDDSRPSA